ncbi:hypothetical protein diail_1952 [Diaporthe ilicicola]|nr:hypothetical protein diail_1952 [Diaporthe ilicicola]
MDAMDHDSPPAEDTPSSNPHDSGATPASTTQTTGVSTASATNPSAGTPATAGTTQTADTSSSGGTPNAPTAAPVSSAAASKRRRGLGVVTPNACTECRKKRAKCDGQQPCSRCSAQKDVECHYEVPVRQSKETLRNEIEQLRRQLVSNESVIGAISQHNEHWEEVLRRLRSGQAVEAISDWLASQLPSGPVVMPSFDRSSGMSANLTPLATFAGANTASYTSTLANAAVSASTALGIMSIREASCGRDSESWYYAGQSIRLAVEMGLHRVRDDSGSSDEVAVQAATFWGAFALDHAWSLATGTLPQCSRFPLLPPKPAIMPDIEASVWNPYTDDGGPLQRSCEQPSNVRSVYKCFCELSELVHDSLYMLHTPGRPIQSSDLLCIYTKLIDWYDSVPEVLRLGHNFTPAVLFAHMYYHFAILLIFRPFVKLRILTSSISPRDLCSDAANAIQGLCTSYSQLYTLERTPSFVPYFVLTSSIMHLATAASGTPSESERQRRAAGGVSTKESPDSDQSGNSDSFQSDPHVVKSINQGISDLTEMAPCHHFAEQALNILRYLARKWNIQVDMDVSKEVKREKEETGQTGVQATHGPEYTNGTRPVTNSLNFFAPDFQEDDYVSSWGALAPPGGASTSSTAARSGETMENPLFWPFPMQGRPMLPSGAALAQAGFELA